MKLVFATNNQHKLDEVRKITAGYAEIISLSDIDCHDDIPRYLRGKCFAKSPLY